jgi:hypothetical protein
MLDAKGYSERKWLQYPALSHVLEDRKLPDEYYELTSVHDNMSDALVRLIEIAILVREFRKQIELMADEVGKEHFTETCTYWKAILKMLAST